MKSFRLVICVGLFFGLFIWLSVYTYQTNHRLQNYGLHNVDNSVTTMDDITHADINLPLFRNANVIFYNRVPKCASTTTYKLIKRLSRKNKFYYNSIGNFPHAYFYEEPEDEVKHVDEKFKRVRDQKALLQEHLYFKDFSKSEVFRNRTLPIYINLIRDPLARLVSHYYYIRYQPGHVRKMSKVQLERSFSDCVKALDPECTHSNHYMAQVAFFCGAMPYCRLPEMGALQQAKRNVVRHYAVVGLMEELRDFFVALEWVLPSWFTGAVDEYDKLDAQNKSVANKLVNIPHSRTLDPESENIMKKLLKEDYDFYHFIKQRFDFYMKQIEQGQARVNTV